MERSETEGGLLARMNYNSWVALGTIVLGAGIWFMVPYHVDEPPVFFGMQNEGLSPKLFPQIAAVGFVVTGIFYFLTSFRIDDENGFAALPPGAYFNMAVVLVLMILYIVFLRPVGFVVSSGLTALAIALFYGSRHIPALLIVSAGMPLLIYFMFTRLLGVSLPPFPWIAL